MCNSSSSSGLTSGAAAVLKKQFPLLTCAPPPYPTTKPSRGWFQVGSRNPPFVLLDVDIPRNAVITATKRTEGEVACCVFLRPPKNEKANVFPCLCRLCGIQGNRPTSASRIGARSGSGKKPPGKKFRRGEQAYRRIGTWRMHPPSVGFPSFRAQTPCYERFSRAAVRTALTSQTACGMWACRGMHLWPWSWIIIETR